MIAKSKSIRIHLLRWLLFPLSLLLFVTTAIAYYLAVSYANENYDNQLLNSADSVVGRLRIEGHRTKVDLPPAALAILRHNEIDKFYYQIIREGQRIYGDPVIPGPYPTNDSDLPQFSYASVNGERVRLVRVKAELPNQEPMYVQVAETLNSRHRLVGKIMIAIIVPELILICLGIIAVSIGVERGLSLLKNLEKALSTRSQMDLTSVPEQIAPVEVLPLVKEINNLLGRLRLDIEFQQRFVANAAHQFRTPLAALKTYIYAAKKIPASDERMGNILARIESGTDRMTHLAGKLLALAKAEPANAIHELVPVDLNSIAAEVSSEFVSEALAKDLDLTFMAADEPAFVRGNAVNLSELAGNLIENAILYTPAGGKILVRVDADEKLCNVALIVQDDGPGIPEEEREHVFERFYRILGTEVPGSGLGLAIVKEIAAAHNATVSINGGSDGAGTSVQVIFCTSASPAK